MESDSFSYVSRVLRKVIAFAIRRGLTFQEFAEIAKTEFVELSIEEISSQGIKPNASRISAMTGIRRPEVRRVCEGSDSGIKHLSMVSRVIALWEQSSKYLTSSGKPRVLTCGSDDTEFHKLVAEVSTDIHPASVLSELLRLDLIEKSPRGVRLKERHHVSTEDKGVGFDMMAEDADLLIRAVEENLLTDVSIKNLHGRTVYDNIYHEDLNDIKQWILSEGGRFHQKVRNFLAEYDKDINPQPGKTPGASVVVCTYSHTKGKAGASKS
ncbi:MAG TPA: DUF6502 family protein [Oligoflexia bacterium]|nr:DUF6502 family protein [Oligoflexia bacterium]HMP47498.1 DUF6502 family protein [Oligoflexia bacterium]